MKQDRIERFIRSYYSDTFAPGKLSDRKVRRMASRLWKVLSNRVDGVLLSVVHEETR